MDTRTIAVPTIADGAGRSQQIKKAASVSGASTERLRLSAIFPKPTEGMRRSCHPRPGEELPVASRPAMLALGCDIVAGGKFLNQLDIGGEPGARKDTFEEIVAEKRILRHAAWQGGLECVDVVDTLARVGALAEKVLVNIGDGSCIRVHAARAGEDALIERSLSADWERRRDAGLEDCIAVHDPSLGLVETRSVQRMGHLADQP